MLGFSPIRKEDGVIAVEDFQSFLIVLKGKIVEILEGKKDWRKISENIWLFELGSRNIAILQYCKLDLFLSMLVFSPIIKGSKRRGCRGCTHQYACIKTSVGIFIFSCKFLNISKVSDRFLFNISLALFKPNHFGFIPFAPS